MADSSFSFPQHFNWPPFFTLQPVQATRQKQLQMWGDLILSYFRSFRLFEIDIHEPLPLWHNESIDRKLGVADRRIVLDFLVAKGNATWKSNKAKDRIQVYWRKPEEWAETLTRFVEERGLSGSICTLYELREGDTGQGQEFHEIHPELFALAIDILEKQGKLALFEGNEAGSVGVKFS